MNPRRVALLRGGAWIEILTSMLVDGLNRNVALLRGGAWIEMMIASSVENGQPPSHSFAGVRGLKYAKKLAETTKDKSHSFAGVRGLK